MSADETPSVDEAPSVGVVVRLRRAHPCGSRDWVVTRAGDDIGLRCIGCGRTRFLELSEFSRQRQPVRRSQTPNALLLFLALTVATLIAPANARDYRQSSVSPVTQSMMAAVRRVSLDQMATPTPRFVGDSATDPWKLWALTLPLAESDIVDSAASATADEFLGAWNSRGFGAVIAPISEAVLVSFEPKLKRGLWRFSVATRTDDGQIRAWRLSPAFVAEPKTVAKLLPIGVKTTLFVRGVETLAVSMDACRAAQRLCEDAPRASKLLAQVQAKISAAQSLCRANRREKIAPLLHAAILIVGQAEALHTNETALAGGELSALRAGFEALTGALSEASVAALGLIPASKTVTLQNDLQQVTVSLRNDGPATITSVVLMPFDNGPTKTVAALRPGQVATATFTINKSDSDQQRYPIAQYIYRYGQSAVNPTDGPVPRK